MKADRWLQLKSMFQAALDVGPDRRAAFLDQACAGDAALRGEIESLLASHEKEDDFLERPAIESGPDLGELLQGDLRTGSWLGPYLVKEKLGQGGMGIVYLAVDTRLGRQVAVKSLAPQYTSDPEHRERLRREARIAATLSHPSIATVFALEEFDGCLYIISEYVQGRTLYEELASGPLPVHRLLDTAIEVAGALAAAHEQGIVHRDLKPENLIRTSVGKIKILDFGLARFQSAHPQDSLIPARLTKAGMFLGTPAYASPEQLLGHEANFHSDIFSFGVILYELASGTHPFSGSDSVSTLARILEADPPGIAGVRPALPPGLDSVVGRCLRKKPEQRYGSARELLADLERIKAQITTASKPLKDDTPPASPGPPPAPGGTLWWWQFHQGFIGFTYYAMLYPMWQVKVWNPGFRGPLLFFTFLATVGIAANLRFYLWFASKFYPEELREIRARVSPWVRWADVLFVCLLLTAALVIIGAHEIIATLLIGVAIAVLAAFLLIEPTTTRAAFPSQS